MGAADRRPHPRPRLLARGPALPLPRLAACANGATYFYRLEDVDRSGRVDLARARLRDAARRRRVARRGRRGAAPAAAAARPRPAEGWTTHGDPTDVSLRVVERSATSVTFELRTGGFYSLAQDDGSQRLFVPGFFDLAEPGFPTLPTRRTWTNAVPGLGARVASVTARGPRCAFDGLVPPRAGAPQAVSMRDGTYQASFRPVAAAALSRGLYPRAQARVLQTAFQGDVKKAYVELAPLRFDASRGRLVLARRLLVTVALRRCRPRRDRARRLRRAQRSASAVSPDPTSGSSPASSPAREGLHAVAWEDLLAATTSGSPDLASSALMLPTSALRLSRKGEAVPFHVEPRSDRFVPGSTLFFLSEGSRRRPQQRRRLRARRRTGRPAHGPRRLRRAAAPARRPREPLASLHAPRSFEKNATFLPALLEAKDFWLWDWGIALGKTKSYPFSLASVVAPAPPHGSPSTSRAAATPTSTPTTTSASPSTAPPSPRPPSTA